MRTGKFIVFEGIDGSGKTTQVGRLAQKLQGKGVKIHTTFEPTNGPVGAILRHPLSSEHAKNDGMAEGARTTAALAASRFGPVLKVSEDGGIAFFDGHKVWEI